MLHETVKVKIEKIIKQAKSVLEDEFTAETDILRISKIDLLRKEEKDFLIKKIQASYNNIGLDLLQSLCADYIDYRTK